MSELLSMKHCIQCGMPVAHRRSTKKFCSGACRQAHWRGLPPIIPDDEELFDLEVEFGTEKALKSRKAQP